MPTLASDVWLVVNTLLLSVWLIPGSSHQLITTLLLFLASVDSGISVSCTQNIQPYLVFSMSQGYKDEWLSCLQEAPSLVMNGNLQQLRQVAVLIHATRWDREETESALPERDKEASQWGSRGGWKMARGFLWRQEWMLAWGNNRAQGSEVCKTVVNSELINMPSWGECQGSTGENAAWCISQSSLEKLNW